ncbi:MAG TPA: DUF4917 family protein [Beijerinckiaceae bacterium]|jgi:hypothetical protein|nr:DUF4917 family protein [Beijerinckiaceae bacterium]
MPELNSDLKTWNELKEVCNWPSLLIGNGFSQNIWKSFGYQSLFETASRGDGAQLKQEDVELFDCLETRNFEAVLSALSISKAVISTLQQDVQMINQREASIRDALIKAVHTVHIPWREMDEKILNHVSAALSSFASVYCTNYDLVTYWAMMKDPKTFRDYFWSGEFDVSDTEIWQKNATAVHFVHGGLHLYRRAGGQTVKRKASENQSLLELFATPFDDAMPLFISEGTAKEKLASIYRSDYLSFVYARLSKDDAPMVIFGSSLSDTDKHIIDAVDAHKGRDVAVSIRTGGNIRQKKAELIRALPNANLHFFDSSTHPLGRPELAIVPEV